MSYHGIHLVVTHCQRPDRLAQTLRSCGELPKIRSITIVLSEQQVIPYRTYLEEQGLNLEINTITYQDTVVDSRGLQVEEAFRQLRRRVRHFLWFREGERWVGKYPHSGWLPLDGGLLRVETSGTTHWEMRTLSIYPVKKSAITEVQWSICDRDGVLPVLQREDTSSTPPQISKIQGDYFILAESDTSEAVAYPHPYYCYRNATKHLLRGELEMARRHFIRARRRHQDREIRSRSYLGQAICLKVLEGATAWSTMVKLLSLSFVEAHTAFLEPLYFLLVWGLEFNDGNTVWKTLAQLATSPHYDIFTAQPPETSLLPYDLSIYHYAFLEIYLGYLERMGRYGEGIQVANVLLARPVAPLPVRKHASQLSRQFSHLVDNLTKYDRCIADTKTVYRPHIELHVTKSTPIYLHSETIEKSRLLQTLQKHLAQEKETLIREGCHFQLEHNRKKHGLHVVLEDHVGFRGLSAYYVSDTEDSPEEYLIKSNLVNLEITNTPRFPNVLKKRSQETKEFSKRTPLAYLRPDKTSSTISIEWYRQVNDQITIPKPKTITSLSKVENYQALVYVDNNYINTQTDLDTNTDINYATTMATLLTCFQSSVHVFYYGNPVIYQDLKVLFGAYMTNLTGYSPSKISRQLDGHGEVPKMRETPPSLQRFSLASLLANSLDLSPIQTPLQMSLVKLSESEIFQHSPHRQGRYIFADSPSIEKALEALLLGLESGSPIRAGLLHLEGHLGFETFRLARYLVEKVLHGTTKVPANYQNNPQFDLIQLSNCNRNHLESEARMVCNSTHWVWKPLDKIQWKGTILFSSAAAVERALNQVKFPDISPPLEHLLRAVTL